MKMENFEMNQKGSALLIAIFFIMILTVIGLSLLLNTSVDNVISNNYSKTVRATYTATSGIERFKSYLLYDYKHDPKGWGNRWLVVPQGSTYTDGTVAPPASLIGGSGSDAYFDLGASAPSTTPYDINPLIPFAVDAALYAEVAADVSNPIVTPGSGYKIMMRNVPALVGGDCGALADCNAAAVYLMAIGRTTTTKAFLNASSRGMNVIEHGAFGNDISVWNNIFFFEGNALSGGGAMTIHGNIHALGDPTLPPNSSAITFATKADVLNSYYYTNANKSLKDPIRSSLSLPEQRDPTNVLNPINSLGAAVRVKNGLIDISTGGAHIGEPVGTGIPFNLIANCRPGCGSYANGFNEPTPAAYARRSIPYDVPANLQSLIKVPQLSDPYKDPSTNITYPDYTAYFIGRDLGVNQRLPGVLGLKLAQALGADSPTCFDIVGNNKVPGDPCANAANWLAKLVWDFKDNLFKYNVQRPVPFGLEPAFALEQVELDPVDGANESNDPLFSAIIGSGPADGKTFMVVASDVAKGVVVVYKEVAPFQRTIGGSTIQFPRVAHGFVYAPPGADMTTLALKADIDGANIDGGTGDGLDWLYDTDTCGAGDVAPCKRTLDAPTSNRLVRKVTNALWKAGRGECGVSAKCYSTVSDANWEASMAYNSNTASRIHDMITPFYLKVTATAPEDADGKLIGYGAIETTDTLFMGHLTYASRFTLYARDSNGGGAGVGKVNFDDNSYAISSYAFPTGAVPATYVAFPCQNNMGIMTTNDIDHIISPHDDFAGSFFAEGTIGLTKQEQILGAMVAGGWLFDAGGNPDFFQAMEISRCLPPYIVAKDPIVFVGAQSWLER